MRTSDPTQGAYVVARRLWRGSDGSDRALVIVPDVETAEHFSISLGTFLGSRSLGQERISVETLLPWDVLPFDTISPSAEVISRRFAALDALRMRRPGVVITTPEALMKRVPSPDALSRALVDLTAGMRLTHEELVLRLDRLGYLRSSLVEDVGQMAVRGAIVDVFGPGMASPCRIELFEDMIESLRLFDPGSQRTIESRNRIRVLPVREILFETDTNEPLMPFVRTKLRERAAELGISIRGAESIEEALAHGIHLPGIEHLAPLVGAPGVAVADYCDKNLEIVLYDEAAVLSALDAFVVLLVERSRRAHEEGRLFPAKDIAYLDSEEVEECFLKIPAVALERISSLRATDSHAAVEPPTVYSLEGLHAALRTARYQERPFQPLAEEIRDRTREGYAVAIVVGQPARAARISDLLAGYDLSVARFDGDPSDFLRAPVRNPKGSVWLLFGEFREGLRGTDPPILLIPERDLFPELSTRRENKSARTTRRFLGSISQLRENDFIVHLDHGIGVYRGLRQISVEGKLGDYLHIEYAEDAKLFLPVDQIGKIQKYAGADAKRPTLSRLGGKQWSNTKAKVKESVAELAGQLITLLAQRELSPGIPLGSVDSDDQAFADTFPYEETPDQEKAIADVLEDLGKSKPMDRLVCGDVGYGKTEVALRAAFKAANAGKQVAVLVPTTILADQHYQTFIARFAQSPIRVARVSRFQSSAENKTTIEGLVDGSVDIVIGTHRLLQRDVSFKDLGLVIIDEEHRFGVAHKEKLKRLRTDCHVLTLTATPIPRTLHLSLIGMRDLSIIETPPVNRQVIRTYVAPYSGQLVREAILREIGRSGQVFYISNRVQNIGAVADELRALVPEARIVFAHGQMKESDLEEIMHRFVTGEADVLVSTTIVESGLDIPNANTILIRNADMFGLAELYQLRGRVGRSSRRAYAYLLIPDPKTLGTDAKKRLEVLQSLDDLGIGFRLALQDMEIRGAGNILGKDQSGQIELVGFELYSRILREAIEEIRNRAARAAPKVPEPVIDPEMRIGFPAYIPPWYVPDVAERVLLYQRLIELSDETEGALMFEEITDRFGNPPEEVPILIELMAFRGLLRRAGIISAAYRDERLTIAFHNERLPDSRRVIEAVRASDGAVRVSPKMLISVAIPADEISTPRDLSRVLSELLLELGVNI